MKTECWKPKKANLCLPHTLTQTVVRDCNYFQLAFKETALTWYWWFILRFSAARLYTDIRCQRLVRERVGDELKKNKPKTYFVFLHSITLFCKLCYLWGSICVSWVLHHQTRKSFPLKLGCNKVKILLSTETNTYFTGLFRLVSYKTKQSSKSWLSLISKVAWLFFK